MKKSFTVWYAMSWQLLLEHRKKGSLIKFNPLKFCC